VTIDYPLNDTAYDSDDWYDDHDLILIMNSSMGGCINLDLLTIEYGDPVWETVNIDLDLSFSGNTTYELDLRDYIFFNDMNYIITVYVSPCICTGICGNTSTTGFMIGDSSTAKQYHVAIDYLDPVHTDYLNTGVIGRGIQISMTSNVSSPGMKSYMYLCNMEDKLLVRSDKHYIMWDSAWWGYEGLTKYNIFSVYFKPHENYHFYTGFYALNYNYANTQFDMLYQKDAVIQPRNFSYHYQGWIKDYRITLDHTGDLDLYGFYLWFGSFSSTAEYNSYIDNREIDERGDETGTHGGDFKNAIDDFGDATGIPFLSIIIALMLISFFALIPIIILKVVPPMPILTLFTFMGLSVSFDIGLLPLWLFFLICVGIILFILYRVWGWIGQGGLAPIADAGRTVYKTGKLIDEGTSRYLEKHGKKDKWYAKRTDMPITTGIIKGGYKILKGRERE
jgi:hypothetical protein